MKIYKETTSELSEQPFKQLLWNRLEVVGFGRLSFGGSLKFFLFAFPAFFRRDQKPANLVYIETVSPIILAALWIMCILWTISVLLWAITIKNFNRAMGSLCTKHYFNFTNFLVNRVMRCSTKGVSHCCFRKAVSNN